jgi:hypothetical protein
MEHLNGVGLGLGLNLLEGAIYDALGDGFFALFHEVVHELGNDQITELWIGVDVAFLCAMAT